MGYTCELEAALPLSMFTASQIDMFYRMISIINMRQELFGTIMTRVDSETDTLILFTKEIGSIKSPITKGHSDRCTKIVLELIKLVTLCRSEVPSA